MPKYHFVSFNHKGLIRQNNEDNLYLNGEFIAKDKLDDGFILEKEIVENSLLLAVCDGMGGEEAGEMASFAAVSNLDGLKEKCFAGAAVNESQIQEAIVVLNQKVLAAAEAVDASSHCGTTLVALAVKDDGFYTVNIGDSRIYLFRKNKLIQLTKDHSEVQRMIDVGFLSKAEARNHAKKNVITRYLGMPESKGRIEATITAVQNLRANDVFVLCSDGLYDMIEDEQILKTIREKSDVPLAERLVNAALEAGGEDNVTVVTLSVQPEKKRGFLRKIFIRDGSEEHE